MTPQSARLRARNQSYAAKNPMRNFYFVLATGVALSGCAVTPPPSRLLAASNPHTRVPVLHSSDAGAGTLTFRPVGPTGWAETSPEPTQKDNGAK